MHFSVCAYWRRSACPLCRRIAALHDLKARKPGFLERAYADRRSSELRVASMDQEYWTRPRMTRLSDPVDLKRGNWTDAVRLMTVEGIELFCEETYVDGDLLWLVARLSPSHLQFFSLPRVLLTVIDLLSRDMDMLLRVHLRDSFLANIQAILVRHHLSGAELAQLMEIMTSWPLHCLCDIWPFLLHALLDPSSPKLADAYPGAVFLLSEIEGRRAHALKTRLQGEFDDSVNKLLGVRPPDRQTAGHYFLVSQLRRAAYSERSEYTSTGALIQELSLALDYGAIERHGALYWGLHLLKECSAGTEPRQLVDVVQAASYLWFALKNLTLNDPEAKRLLGHADYSGLGDAINQLERAYPKCGAMGDNSQQHEQVKQAAAIIRRILYEGSHGGQDSFCMRLQQYLAEYTRPVGDVHRGIAEWAKGQHAGPLDVSLRYVDNSDQAYVILHESAFNEVCDNLLSNFEHAQRRWSKQHTPVGEMFVADQKKFAIDVYVQVRGGTVLVP